MKTQTFSDFSGGVTDRAVPGEHPRYTIADNLLISEDKKLYTRDGINIFSSSAYSLPAQERVAKLSNFDFDSELIASQNQKVFAISGSIWNEVVGPENSAFPQNTAGSILTEAQSNHTLYLASDSGDLPIKIYRDENDFIQLRTAGLPKPPVTKDFEEDSAKLAAGIALAIEIKTKLKAHVDDFGAAPAAHIAQDVAVSAALGALSNPVTLANLIAYTKTLRQQYNAHLNDSKLALNNQLFHIQQSDITLDALFSAYVIDPILNFNASEKLPADAALNTIDEVTAVLNDLRTVYNWHTLAPVTHGNATQTSPAWGANQVSLDVIDLDKTTPYFLPGSNFQTLFNYVNSLKLEYNTHAQLAGSLIDGFFHIVPDSSNLIKMADATDLNSAVALIGCIYYHYSRHFESANKGASGINGGFFNAAYPNPFVFTGNVTAGSNNILGVTPNPATFTLPNGYFLTKITSDTTAPFTNWSAPTSVFPAGATVASTAAAAINLTGGFNSSVTGTFTFSFHWSGIHTDVDLSTDAFLPSFLAGKEFRETLGTDYTDLDAIAALAKKIALVYKGHVTSGTSVISDSEYQAGGQLGLNFFPQEGYVYYDLVLTSGASTTLPPHGMFAQDSLFYPPTQPSLPRGTPASYFDDGVTAARYLYRYVYTYTYKVGDTEFLDVSAPSEPIEVYGFVSPQDYTSGTTNWANSIGVVGISPLSNTPNTNYDTANIKIEFYRTIAEGSVYYFVQEISNGTATITDYLDDTNLLSNKALYTSGGVVANDAPPATGVIHILENRMYYAKKNKVFQSLSNDPDSVPETFFDTFEEDIVALSSTRSNLVAFSELNVYRVEGEFDELGNGFMRHERIFDRTGCVAPQSAVKADNGVLFAGRDGFYFTDAFQCFRVTDFQATFTGYTLTDAQKKAIVGAYDSTYKKVYWTVKTLDSYANPNIVIVLDLQFGVKKDVTPFTTFSGGFDNYAGFNPTSLVFYKDAIHYGDGDGFILFNDTSTKMDLTKDLSTPAALWEKRTLLWNYKTCDEDYGGANFKKYFTRVNVEFEQLTNLSVQINSDADKGRIISNLPIIRSRKLLDWGDPKIDWTSSVYTAKEGGVIDEFRRFRGDGSLRSNYRAVELKNAYCVIVASNIMGPLTVSAVSANLWALTLAGAPTYKWPLYSVGYFVRIAGVDYPVTARMSDSVVRVSDLGLTPLSAQAGIQWEMWGYPKNEAVRLINMDVNYEFLGQTQKDYQGVTSTDGGQNDS